MKTLYAQPLQLREANFVMVWRFVAPSRGRLPFEMPIADQ